MNGPEQMGFPDAFRRVPGEVAANDNYDDTPVPDTRPVAEQIVSMFTPRLAALFRRLGELDLTAGEFDNIIGELNEAGEHQMHYDSYDGPVPDDFTVDNEVITLANGKKLGISRSEDGITTFTNPEK